MTVEEIKEAYSMKTIVERYGFQPTRAGFIPCPFHEGDRQPSLKVYDRDFYCFSCGAHGDIYTFVQMIDGVSFKEAYQSLGGQYQRPAFSSCMAIYHSQKQRIMRQKEAKQFREKMRMNSMLISIYRAYMDRSEPFSDVWCDCYNALQYQLYVQSELNGLEER